MRAEADPAIAAEARDFRQSCVGGAIVPNSDADIYVPLFEDGLELQANPGFPVIAGKQYENFRAAATGDP